MIFTKYIYFIGEVLFTLDVEYFIFKDDFILVCNNIIAFSIAVPGP